MQTKTRELILPHILWRWQQQFGAGGSTKNRLKQESSVYFFSSDPVQLYYHICGSIPPCPPAGSHQQHLWDPSGRHQNGPSGTSFGSAEDKWHWWAGWTKRAAAFQWNVSDACVCATFVGLALFIMATKQDNFGGLEFTEPLNLCS